VRRLVPVAGWEEEEDWEDWEDWVEGDLRPRLAVFLELLALLLALALALPLALLLAVAFIFGAALFS